MSTEQCEAVWMVTVAGQQYGPYRANDLVGWIQSGRILPDTVVRNGLQELTAQQFLVQCAAPMPPSLDVRQAAIAPPALATTEPPAIPARACPPVPMEPPVILMPIEEVASWPTAPPSHSMPQGPSKSELALETLANRGAEAEDDDVADRNQIVVIGRRQSGKTIFLASIYGKLWKSLDGMTAKALSGETHKQMMEINRLLQQGQWPSSTTGTSEVAMEIEYHGKKRLLVTLDFAGELFSKAFVREQDDEPAVRNLLRHIDRAAAVLLLIDPSVISGKDADAVVDDDFGVVQAVQRIRNWPGGDAVPIALVLTKMDRHQRLIDSAGGVKEFVRQHFPALIRTMREIPIFQVSAVQVDIGEDGLAKPRQDSALINIENPLRYCLSKIDRSEQEQQRLQMQEGRRQQAISMEQEERRSARRHKTLWVLVIAGALILWIFILAMIVIKRV